MRPGECTCKPITRCPSLNSAARIPTSRRQSVETGLVSPRNTLSTPSTSVTLSSNAPVYAVAMLSRNGRYLDLTSAKTSRQQAALATASGR